MGSSSSKMAGWCSSARARPRRCVVPVEKVRTWRSSSPQMPMRSAAQLDANARFRAGNIVHGRKQGQIFAAAQASVKSFVAAGVIAEAGTARGRHRAQRRSRQSHARPRVGIINVASTRRSVDFPAPFGPTIATASAGWTEKEIPASALSVGRATGCSKARHPERAGGKYFSSDSTKMAGADITLVITEFAVANPVPPLLFAACASTIRGGRIDKRRACLSEAYRRRQPGRRHIPARNRRERPNGRTSLPTYSCCRSRRAGFVSSR